MSLSKVESNYKANEEKSLPLETFLIIRTDGHKFRDFTSKFFFPPFDPNFEDLMIRSVRDLMLDETGTEIILSYVKSDESCALLPPGSRLFARSPLKLASNISAHLSAITTKNACEQGIIYPVVFYSDVYCLPNISDVQLFLQERQEEAYLNLVSAYARYLVKKGEVDPEKRTEGEVAKILRGYDLLVGDKKNWKKYGAIIFRDYRKKERRNKMTGEKVITKKKAIRTQRAVGLFQEKNPDLEKIILGGVTEKTKMNFSSCFT